MAENVEANVEEQTVAAEATAVTQEKAVEEASAAVVAETPAETKEEDTVVEKPKAEAKRTRKSKRAKEAEAAAEQVATQEKVEEPIPEPVVEKPTEEEKAAEEVAEEDAASDASTELNLVDGTETAASTDSGEQSKYFYITGNGRCLALDTEAFLSVIIMKKYRFGIIVNDAENVDYNAEVAKCISSVKAAVNKLHNPDIEIKEIPTPKFIEVGKFYNVITVHIPFDKQIPLATKEMHNTILILSSKTDPKMCKFVVRDGNYAAMNVDSSKDLNTTSKDSPFYGKQVLFKGFQSLTVSKPKDPNKEIKESLAAAIYANESLNFKLKDIATVNKSNLNVCKMNMFGPKVNEKFEPVSRHDINFGKRFGVLLWFLVKDEKGFWLYRHTYDISLKDKRVFNGKMYIQNTDGVNFIIRDEEINHGDAIPPFEEFFQREIDGTPNGEILATMLNSPRESVKWTLFDNDVKIIDHCMFDGLEIEM